MFCGTTNENTENSDIGNSTYYMTRKTAKSHKIIQKLKEKNIHNHFFFFRFQFFSNLKFRVTYVNY